MVQGKKSHGIEIGNGTLGMEIGNGTLGTHCSNLWAPPEHTSLPPASTSGTGRPVTWGASGGRSEHSHCRSYGWSLGYSSWPPGGISHWKFQSHLWRQSSPDEFCDGCPATPWLRGNSQLLLRQDSLLSVCRGTQSRIRLFHVSFSVSVTSFLCFLS